VELLEHEADGMGSKGRQLLVRQPADVGAGDAGDTARRTVEGTDDVEQRRLPRS
jgi:hypothetical protein